VRAFLIFLAAGIGTYLIRISGTVFLGNRDLPPKVTRALQLTGPAAMSAIIAHSLLLSGGDWRGFGAWHIAALVAVGVALWKKSMGWSMAIGALAFAGLLVLT
jgi:branched-subunit amino acid transport protein